MKPIVLVGMMGAGKSTAGRLLSARRGWRFVDADELLEQRTGATIPTIFAMEGEEGFRARETKLLHELLECEDCVIATGGGVVIRPENRLLLKQSAVVVYLVASFEVLWERLQNDRSRPLLQVPDPKGRLAELLAARDPLYREVADLIVPTDSGRPLRGVQAIEMALQRYGVPLPPLRDENLGMDLCGGP
ncbi:MAG: shikimate kinase [Hydrogenophilus sp.]|nr:shikimate kinase [Hydrogenophilus sp.]